MTKGKEVDGDDNRKSCVASRRGWRCGLRKWLRGAVRGLHSASLFQNRIMSQHRSLKGSSTIAAKRNVLKRFERVELLKKRGLFKAGDKVIGLRKTKPDA